jgi:hypothetical protein
MKMPDTRLPVKLVGFREPIGFVDVGTIVGDGPRMKPARGGDVPAFGGDRIIAALQPGVHVSLTVDFAGVDPLVFAALNSPLAYLALQARRINPHWYLESDTDD